MYAHKGAVDQWKGGAHEHVPKANGFILHSQT